MIKFNSELEFLKVLQHVAFWKSRKTLMRLLELLEAKHPQFVGPTPLIVSVSLSGAVLLGAMGVKLCKLTIFRSFQKKKNFGYWTKLNSLRGN